MSLPNIFGKNKPKQIVAETSNSYAYREPTSIALAGSWRIVSELNIAEFQLINIQCIYVQFSNVVRSTTPVKW